MTTRYLWVCPACGAEFEVGWWTKAASDPRPSAVVILDHAEACGLDRAETEAKLIADIRRPYDALP